MAMTAFGPLVHPTLGMDAGSLNPSFSNQITINASGDKIGWVIQVPKDGTLDGFEVRLATVGNNPDNGLRFSFQDVDMSTGLPDGTQDQFFDHTPSLTSNTWLAPNGVLTDTGAGGGVKRTVTSGQILACVIEFTNFTVSDTLSFFASSDATPLPGNSFYILNGSTGTFTKASGAPVIALKYSDGSYAEFPYPIGAWVGVGGNLITTNTYANNSTPDERALRFQVPIACRLVGCWARFDCDGPGDMVIYDAASSALATSPFDQDARGANLNTPGYFYFTDPIDLSAATTYRISIKPSSTTSIINAEITMGVSAACQGGAQFYLSTRTDAGAWTDTTTARPMIGLIIDAIDIGGGGGGSSSEDCHVSFG